MNLIVYYLIAIVVIIIDQLTKWIVVKNMKIGDSIPIIENVFHITSHRNPGAAFGILQGQMWFFYIITVIVVAFIAYYIHKEARQDKVLGITLGLILGGAIGNFIDRVLFGEVVDFLDVYIFTYNFPIFNVADSALVVGVGILMIKFLRDERKTKEKA